MFQRPQHLLTRCARDRRVFHVEEPIVVDGIESRFDAHARGNVTVIVPCLPPASAEAHDALQRRLSSDLLVRYDIDEYLLWYYTPMAMSFTEHLTPAAIVYDCMDELSAFKGASAQLKQELVRIAADVATFVRACEAAMAEDASARITRHDAFLRQMSWDGTWNRIKILVETALVSADVTAAGESIAAAG